MVVERHNSVGFNKLFKRDALDRFVFGVVKLIANKLLVAFGDGIAVSKSFCDLGFDPEIGPALEQGIENLLLEQGMAA